MTKLLKLVGSPALVAVVGLLAGLAVGLGWFWRVGGLLVTQAAAARVTAAKDKKAQGWDFWTIEIDNLAAELKGEKSRLKKQSEALDQRAARLTAEQQELEKLRASIEAMRKEIGERVIEITADESKNLRTLAQTYTNLTPRAAIAIIREMDDTTVVKIFSLMKPDVVAPILEEMSRVSDKENLLARRAATLSEKLRLLKAGKPATAS